MTTPTDWDRPAYIRELIDKGLSFLMIHELLNAESVGRGGELLSHVEARDAVLECGDDAVAALRATETRRLEWLEENTQT